MSDFKAKMHQIRFRLWIRPRPRWQSLQSSPRSLAGFKGPLRGREEEGMVRGQEEGKERKGREGGRKGTKGMGETGEEMGWDGEGKKTERRKGRERQERGYSPKVQFLAPPLVT